MRFTGMSEFLIYGLLFVAIVGFNLFKQFLAAQREQQRRASRSGQRQQSDAAELRPSPSAESRSEPVETHWGRSPDQDSAAPPRAEPLVALPQEVVLATRQLQQRREHKPAAKMPVALAKGSRRRLFRHRGELRHGIVLMTVLGPCRALQPYIQEQQ